MRMKPGSQNHKNFSTCNSSSFVHLFLCLLFSRPVQAQPEFETYTNGLIYSESTMQKLERIVDSLNLKYKTCELNKVFYTKSQAVGHRIILDSHNVKQAKEDLDKNISFDAFIAKYGNVDLERTC